jgi:hypothetical protein
MVGETTLSPHDFGGYFYGVGAFFSSAAFVGKIEYVSEWNAGETCGYVRFVVALGAACIGGVENSDGAFVTVGFELKDIVLRIIC